MFTPRASSSKLPTHAQDETYPVLAAELATEYASLREPDGCPSGIYLIPSFESLQKWHGVFFVHRGPYAGCVLRFTLLFPETFPHQPPAVRFDSDVFHPMVHPKTKIWQPRGRLALWQPRVHHVPHLLHSLKSSFKSRALDSMAEDEAVNKQVWSLYRHSRQTFLSMTAQRALKSASSNALFPSSDAPDADRSASPSTPKHRQNASTSSEPGEIGTILFRHLDAEDEAGLMARLMRGLQGSSGSEG